ncbi:bifunctional chorismate mutase/prephenate dehydratase [Anaerosporobacter faecicola]|uniref:bifunctional chorismate mutase/prephenate dehydratase n=1 Tax=Anaerosporobacter faecicola TaxID=2718714 RepID=UPI00143A726F|nr:bifunctional chorismate mutase/prephenate dehydratase [Anaerosporobacter faecicola]
MVDLLKSREEIDRIDQQILSLFEERMDIAKNVAEYKISVGKKVYDKQREEEKLSKLGSMASNTFNEQAVEELFTQIMAISRKLQYTLVQSGNITESFSAVEKLPISPNTKVVFFGQEGTYTQQCMEDYFGTEINSYNELTFRKVMEAVKEGKADYGVLPIENSSTGGITDIYDLLVEYDNCIVGEHVVKIENALLGLEGATIENLKKVYSHPQPLMQCAKFLEEHDYIQKKEFASTAASAMKVKEDGDLTQAAIGSRKAAQCYGLQILKDSINSDQTNCTRFIIIANQKIFIEDANKVSICFELPHKSGTLYNMLSHFIYNNLNMVKIESRPINGKKFEYRFFVDVEGNLKDAGVINALRGIKEEASTLRVLGNIKTE